LLLERVPPVEGNPQETRKDGSGRELRGKQTAEFGGCGVEPCFA
jgi:hypothetical protein